MNNHDPLCMGSVAVGICDCAAIKRIREDERAKAWAEAKAKYKSKYKKKYKQA